MIGWIAMMYEVPIGVCDPHLLTTLCRPVWLQAVFWRARSVSAATVAYKAVLVNIEDSDPISSDRKSFVCLLIL